MSELVGDKRYRRRIEREKLKGPERAIVTRKGDPLAPDYYILECGHTVDKPQAHKNSVIRPPSHYRCMQCRESNSK